MTTFKDWNTGRRDAVVDEAAAEREQRRQQVDQLATAMTLTRRGDTDLIEVLGLQRWQEVAARWASRG